MPPLGLTPIPVKWHKLSPQLSGCCIFLPPPPPPPRAVDNREHELLKLRFAAKGRYHTDLIFKFKALKSDQLVTQFRKIGSAGTAPFEFEFVDI